MKHKCRIKKSFGVRRNFAQISPNVLAKFLSGKVSPYKLIYSDVFTNSTKLSNHLCPNFQDFVRIFNKSKLLGRRLHPLHPQLLHHCHEVNYGESYVSKRKWCVRQKRLRETFLQNVNVIMY